MIYDNETFLRTARTFYDNGDCNSLKEFEEDVAKIVMINNHFNRFDKYGETNFPLLLNHFISFVNCFGIISEDMLKFKIPEHEQKLNALFVVIGHKRFDGTFKIQEDFFIHLKQALKG